MASKTTKTKTDEKQNLADFIKGVHGDLRNQVQKGTEAFLYCLILKHVTGNSINDAISYGYLVVFSKLAMIFNPVP